MNHTVKVIVLIVVLVGIIVTLGLVVGKGNLTGATIAKNMACYEDQDCSDSIEATEDVCKNPGTEYSLCVNRVRR